MASKRGLLIGIVPRGKGEAPDDDDEERDDDDEEEEESDDDVQTAQELLDAIKGDDPKELLKAFRALKAIT